MVWYMGKVEFFSRITSQVKFQQIQCSQVISIANKFTSHSSQENSQSKYQRFQCSQTISISNNFKNHSCSWTIDNIEFVLIKHFVIGIMVWKK